MDTKLLKQKILDLAIRGKLVPQDPNDEPASVLLERIRAEREQLIKQGKLKRSKSTSDNQHYQNVPFEIPASWEWTTIGELLINRDSERIPLSSAVREKQTNKIYPYYGAAGIIDMVDQFLFSERLLLIGEDGANLLSKSKDNAFFEVVFILKYKVYRFLRIEAYYHDITYVQFVRRYLIVNSFLRQC